MKHFLYAGLIAVVAYVVLFRLIESRRVVSAPWRVEFGTNASGEARLTVRQDRILFTNLDIVFQGRKPSMVLSTNLTFNEARPVPYRVPFGECVFQDTTFLPGTVVFQLFGQTVELMPRALIIERTEYAWTNRVVKVAP